MFPENHWRFSSTYTHELLRGLIWGKHPLARRHTFLDFIKSIFQTLFISRISSLSLNRKLIQEMILKFLKQKILLVQTLETEFYQFNKLDKAELNNHNNLTKDLC